MTRMNPRVLGFFLCLTVSLLLCVSCGGGKPSTVSRPVSSTGLTTVSLGNDVTVRVPAGALPDGTTVNVVKASGGDAAPGELEGGKSVGSAFKIEVGDQELSKPITIEIAFDPKSLPKDTPKEAVFLAYYDQDKQEWVPVGGQVDTERNVILVETNHLSWWNPFSWNWEAWIAVMKKGLSVKLTDWVEGFQLLTTECKKSGQAVTVDESKANNVLQGCVTNDDASKPELRVVNLKSFYLGISPAPGGPGYPEATLLGPGDAVSFTASTSDTPPATVNADFTEPAMWRFVVGLVARMIPSGDLIPNEGLAFIAEGLRRDFAGLELGEKLDAGDSWGAAESFCELITGDSFVELFVRLATDYGQKNGVDMMTKWTQQGLSKVFWEVGLVDVIVSATDFVANYVLNNSSQVVFNWQQVSSAQSPSVPPSGDSRFSPPFGPADDQMANVAFEMAKAVYTLDFAAIVALADDPNGHSVGLPGVVRVVPEQGEEWLYSPAGFSSYCAQHAGGYNDCTMYEIGSIREAERNCENASAAEALNGYGRKCIFGFDLAVREAGAAGFFDTHFCVVTQMKASTPKVMGADDISDCPVWQPQG